MFLRVAHFHIKPWARTPPGSSSSYPIEPRLRRGRKL
jgi:hypothetical protein